MWSEQLWALYCDLEENFGSVKTTQATYDMALELKARGARVHVCDCSHLLTPERGLRMQVATPAMVLGYASFLEERQYFEESFKVCYEFLLVVLLCCCVGVNLLLLFVSASVLLCWCANHSFIIHVQAYERGVTLFPFPHVRDIWVRL